MTNDKNDPFNSDDDFESFLADLAGSPDKTPSPAAVPTAAPTQKPAPSTGVGVDYDLDFDDGDDDGATRVGQIPAELLAALGRKAPERPASDVRPTDRPPPAQPDETEVELDDFGDVSIDRVESLAPPIGTPTLPPQEDSSAENDETDDEGNDRPTLGFDEPLVPPAAAAASVATTLAPVAFDVDDDDISIEAGGEEIVIGDDDDDDDDGISIEAGGEEYVLDGDDDEVVPSAPRPTAQAPTAPKRAAPPILTLAGRDLLVARASMLASLAGRAKPESLADTYLAAAELGERAKLPEVDAWLEAAAPFSAVARRKLARRGRRSVRSLTRDSLGADVSALDAMLDAVVLARSDESPLGALERATELAKSTQLKRLSAAAAADVAARTGDAAKAATLRLSTLGDDQPTSTSLAAARRLRQLGSATGTATALAHASGRTTRLEVSNALSRWSDAFAGTDTAPSDDQSVAELDARAIRPNDREAALMALAELGDADDRANFLALAAERAVARRDFTEAVARFDQARRLTSRTGFVDALRDSLAAMIGDAAKFSPTPVHDSDDAPLAELGRACIRPEVTSESLQAILAVRDMPRISATAERLAADVAANLGEPTEWVDALARERRAAAVGAAGIDVARALVFARAGDREAAIAAVSSGSGGYSSAARALLLIASDPAAAAAALAEGRTTSPHDLALRTRLDRNADVDVFRHALDDAPGDGILALRLEQAARRTSNRTAELVALDALAKLADDPTDRTKLRLLAAAGSDEGADTLALAPNDPILLAEALLGRAVPAPIRDRAIEALTANAPAIVQATLRARAATLVDLDGSPSDAALQLRLAHEAAPNEPSIRVSLELAELGAEQSVRVAHRLFAIARSEADDATRARAFARLAELDRRETVDASAALASLHAVNELAPLHVPTLRALEAIARDRGDTSQLGAIESRLAGSLAPGRSADAHARLAIRHLVADSPVPADASRIVALGALARGTTSTRLLRWAEHAARSRPEGREILALQGRIDGTDDNDERVELLARISAFALRRGDVDRARASLDEAFERSPEHPAIAIERATLLDGAGDPVAAALAHEAAASVCRTESQAVVHLMRAAEHHEIAGSNDRARAALEAAHERAPTQSVILDSLADALHRWGDSEGSLAIVDRRIELGGEPAEMLAAHRKRAALAEQLEATNIARAAYVDILALEPNDIDVLRRVAQLAIAAGDGAVAVDALIRLARLQKDAGELIGIFRALGDAYERLSPDARRAEASYRRVIQLDPTDPIANQQLVGILVAQARWSDAIIVVDGYSASTPGTKLSRDLRFSIARGLEGAGDARQAETILEAVRKEVPTDSAVVLEIARFFERQGAKPALSMHLNRASADVRRAFEEAPSRASLEGLLEIHRLRGRADAFACAAATAATLGVTHALQGQPLRDHVEGAGKRANDREVDEVVAPRSLPDGTRAVLQMAGDAIERAFPFDPRPFKTEKLGKDVPVRAEAQRVAEWFGFDDVVILVTAAAPRICVPVSASPFTIVMGRELPVITTEVEREFLFVRAAKMASAGLSFAMRLQPAQVSLALHALVRAHDPRYEPAGVDVATLEEPAKVIAKHTSQKSELGALCLEMGSRPNFEPQRFGIAAAEWSDRVALVATGQTHAGVSALLRLGGHELATATDFDARLRLIRTMPEAWGLLAFSLSDAHAEARVRAGIARG